jgi:uncharacterized protein (DUF697 family)
MLREVDIPLIKGVNMSKGQTLRVVNAVLGVLIVTQATSGLLADDMNPDLFEAVHVGGGVLMVACTVAHVWMNWGWVKVNYFKR